MTKDSMITLEFSCGKNLISRIGIVVDLVTWSRSYSNAGKLESNEDDRKRCIQHGKVFLRAAPRAFFQRKAKFVLVFKDEQSMSKFTDGFKSMKNVVDLSNIQA